MPKTRRILKPKPILLSENLPDILTKSEDDFLIFDYFSRELNLLEVEEINRKFWEDFIENK